MFYLTKEALVDTHAHQPPTFSLPLLPSPILGEHAHTHTHTFIGTSHTHTLSSLNTHAHTRARPPTPRARALPDQPAAICSARSVQSSQNTLFTTIHHITFPQCHSLVLEKAERRGWGGWCREAAEESREQNSHCTTRK